MTRIYRKEKLIKTIHVYGLMCYSNNVLLPLLECSNSIELFFFNIIQ